MPPITAAVKPLRPITKPIEAAVGTRSANITPPAPASAEPIDEREHDHAVDVDAHHRRRLAVERGRAHRLARARPRHEQPEHDHEREGREDRDDPDQRDVHVADVEALDVERAAVEVEDAVVVLLRAEHQLERAGEEERHAERADQRGDARRVAQRPVGEALDRDAEDRAARPWRRAPSA